jgi:hypothetical protein
MLASPFAFYRGGALVMAADLARGPSSGVYVQACGDAHLSNFAMFATPERTLAFDINDFDGTHPAPFDWDVTVSDVFKHQGGRVAFGQRLMQASSDLFLGSASATTAHRLQVISRHRLHGRGRHGQLRRGLRRGAGPCPCALRQRQRDRRVSGEGQGL